MKSSIMSKKHIKVIVRLFEKIKLLYDSKIYEHLSVKIMIHHPLSFYFSILHFSKASLEFYFIAF